MNEVISALQSAIALNRQSLHKHNVYLECLLEGYHSKSKRVKDYKKYIAQLVRIQKMLKKQLYNEIEQHNFITKLYNKEQPYYVEEL